jgi:hypothetical protein
MADRWFDKLGAISIGAQCNGPEDHGLDQLKIVLWKELVGSVVATRCSSIDHYALVLRIGGRFGDFAPEQTHRIRRNKKLRLIGCDIDVPVEAWRSRPQGQLPEYLGTRVREALGLMVARLERDGEAVDVAPLFESIDNGIRSFLDRAKVSRRPRDAV